MAKLTENAKNHWPEADAGEREVDSLHLPESKSILNNRTVSGWWRSTQQTLETLVKSILCVCIFKPKRLEIRERFGGGGGWKRGGSG